MEVHGLVRQALWGMCACPFMGSGDHKGTKREVAYARYYGQWRHVCGVVGALGFGKSVECVQQAGIQDKDSCCAAVWEASRDGWNWVFTHAQKAQICSV